jgi:hypothetical protein
MLALTLGTIMLFGFWTLLVNQDNTFGIGPPRRAPEQLLYVNPGIAMLDVVGNTEPGGFGGINAGLAQLRGEVPDFGGAEPGPAIDEFGNPAQQPFDAGSGYWWPRIAITFIGLAVLLTFLSTRFVVPAGMRWAFRRGRPAASLMPIAVGPSSDPGGATLEEIEEVER